MHRLYTLLLPSTGCLSPQSDSLAYMLEKGHDEDTKSVAPCMLRAGRGGSGYITDYPTV